MMPPAPLPHPPAPNPVRAPVVPAPVFQPGPQVIARPRFPPPAVPRPAEKKAVDETSVANIMAMGFKREEVVKALTRAHGNQEFATELLLGVCNNFLFLLGRTT